MIDKLRASAKTQFDSGDYPGALHTYDRLLSTDLAPPRGLNAPGRPITTLVHFATARLALSASTVQRPHRICFTSMT